MSRQPRKQRGLATWLASAATPLFVVDRRRRVVFFNAGCEQLTGWTAGEVVGKVCEFASQPDHSQVESLTGVLCPPPRAFEGLEQAIPAVVQTRSGVRLPRLIRFLPLSGEELQIDRVLGTIAALPEPSSKAALEFEHGQHAELSALRAELRTRYGVTTLIGRSARFQQLMKQAELACRHTGSIHFLGEAGAGKEHLARFIHFQGESGQRAIVPLDAACMTRSELSETVKRVLRDARDPETTRLSPGTLYLKHVDRLPDTIQELLLQECSSPSSGRFWEQTHDPHPGARAAESACPVRLMSSSLDDLDAAVCDDRLREDFVHLLTTQQIHVPRLRDRPDDVPLLAQYFLEALNRDQEVQVSDFSDDVWAAFRKYAWPGNLDELRSVITEARQNCDQHTICMQDLPFRFRAGVEAQSISPTRPVEIVPLDDKLAVVERDHIQRALLQTGHNKSLAAKLLGMTRPRLYRRMQLLGLVESDGDAAR